MDISDIRNGIMASSLMQVQQITDPAIKDSTAKTSMEFGSIAGSGADVSKPSELLSRLEQLKNDNPEKFTDVMNDIAGLLQQASEELAETDSEEASFLSMLSSVFSSVAQTGDLSQLQPAGEKAPPPPPSRGPGRRRRRRSRSHHNLRVLRSVCSHRQRNMPHVRHAGPV